MKLLLGLLALTAVASAQSPTSQWQQNLQQAAQSFLSNNNVGQGVRSLGNRLQQAGTQIADQMGQMKAQMDAIWTECNADQYKQQIQTAFHGEGWVEPTPGQGPPQIPPTGADTGCHRGPPGPPGPPPFMANGNFPSPPSFGASSSSTGNNNFPNFPPPPQFGASSSSSTGGGFPNFPGPPSEEQRAADRAAESTCMQQKLGANSPAFRAFQCVSPKFEAQMQQMHDQMASRFQQGMQQIQSTFNNFNNNGN